MHEVEGGLFVHGTCCTTHEARGLFGVRPWARPAGSIQSFIVFYCFSPAISKALYLRVCFSAFSDLASNCHAPTAPCVSLKHAPQCQRRCAKAQGSFLHAAGQHKWRGVQVWRGAREHSDVSAAHLNSVQEPEAGRAHDDWAA